MFCCVTIFLLLFCFFKQKTAYEMRISDWSSDVCSSDLAVVAVAPLRCTGARRGHGRGASCACRGQLAPPAALDDAHPPARTAEWTDPGLQCEIGRASCRESVCQYV